MTTTIPLDEPSTRAFSLDQYAPHVGAAEIDELRALAAPLRGRRVQMVNSTAVGGGVAEILAGLLPLMGELGLATSWDVLAGGTFLKSPRHFTTRSTALPIRRTRGTLKFSAPTQSGTRSWCERKPSSR
jgi:hypothetical protein